MNKIAYIINLKDIRELKVGKYFDRLNSFIKKKLAIYTNIKIIDSTEILDTILVPILDDDINKISHRLQVKKYKQVVDLLIHNNINIVILGKNFIDNEIFKEILKSHNIYICNLEILNIFYKKILDKIKTLINSEIMTLNIGVIMNNVNSLNVDIVKDIAKYGKFISVLSINKNEFNNISNELYNDLGVLIKLSSNPKVAIKECDIILNFDGTQEFFDMCSVKNKSIIVNFQNTLKMKKARFDGIMINGINFETPKGYTRIKHDLDIRYLIQGLILADCNTDIDSLRVDDALSLISSYKIKNFIGLNGVIDEKEFNF